MTRRDRVLSGPNRRSNGGTLAVGRINRRCCGSEDELGSAGNGIWCGARHKDAMRPYRDRAWGLKSEEG
nr:hypothetical protein CFP56_64142 [Quercus suber]